jgi:hypothetical protein
MWRRSHTLPIEVNSASDLFARLNTISQQVWTRVNLELTKATQAEGIAMSSRFVNKKVYSKVKESKHTNKEQDFDQLLDQQQQLSDQMNLF